jgi:hypothetical protein
METTCPFCLPRESDLPIELDYECECHACQRSLPCCVNCARVRGPFRLPPLCDSCVLALSKVVHLEDHSHASTHVASH